MAGEIIAIRKPPVDAVFALHLPRRSGKCPWCGEEIDERTPVRKQIKTIHAACNLELSIITDPAAARAALFERDKGVCAECGEDWSEMSRFLPAHRNPDGTASTSYSFDSSRKEWPCCRLVVISLWHNDHRVPLWKVRHLEPLKRIEYFKLQNLQTLCDRCHKLKSRAEEAEKAKMDYQAGEGRKARPKRSWPRRAMKPDHQPRVRDINDD